MKKMLTVFLIVATVCFFAFANGSNESNQPLTVMVMGAGAQVNALKAACEAFTAESGIAVDFSAPGDDYEALLNTKIASGDLPDVFDTSGWSLRRYKEYLADLSKESFAERITPLALSAVTDANGKFYTVPFDTDVSGIVYNVDVLKEAGVDPDQILTWADFTAACEKIKAIGKTPISCGSSSGFTAGWVFLRIAPAYFLEGKNDKSKDLLAGTFDEATWTEINALVDSWVTKGYFNEDVISGDFMGDLGRLGAGQCGFVFIQNVAISMLGQDNIGMMPLPARNSGEERTLISSVNVALGIAKNTKNKKNAEKLLEFLTRAEVAKTISDSTGNVAAINGAASVGSLTQPYIDRYANVKAFDFFDRGYLPIGIWDTICAEGQNVLAHKSGAVESAAKQIKASFDEKF